MYVQTVINNTGAKKYITRVIQTVPERRKRCRKKVVEYTTQKRIQENKRMRSGAVREVVENLINQAFDEAVHKTILLLKPNDSKRKWSE